MSLNSDYSMSYPANRGLFLKCVRKDGSLQLASADNTCSWNLLANLLATGLLIAIIWFPIVYVGNTAITLDRIFTLLLLNLLLFKAAGTKRFFVRSDTRRLVVVAASLIAYMLLIDLIHNDPLQGAKDAVKRMVVVLALPVIEELKVNDNKKIDTILLLSLVPIAIGFIQIFNPHFTLNTFFPAIRGIRVAWPEHMTLLIERTGRIVGTDNTSIGSGLLFGIIAIISFFKWTENHSRTAALWFAAAVILTFFTGTRSAIFGIIPSILCAYLLINAQRGRAFVIPLLAMLAMAGFLYFVFLPIFKSGDLRLFYWRDTSTVGKLYSNWLTACYVLRESPFWGISRVEIGNVIISEFSKKYPGNFLSINSVLTDHSQIGWMLRYYGLIGLGLFTCLVRLLVKKIKSKPTNYLRLVLMGVLVYIFQFSLLHNTFFLALPLFWLLLAVDVPDSNHKIPQCL